MKVCVIGTGTMGGGISKLLCSKASVRELVIISRNLESADNSILLCGSYLEKLVEKEILNESEVQFCLGKIRASVDLAEISSADLVIETVSENLEIKYDTYKRMAAHVSSNMIIASNTSSMSITEFAFCLPHPENVVGLHFFNPATAMKLVEIVVSQVTSESIVGRMQEFAKSIGKEPVVVKEAPGFIVNRILIPMINEAVSIYSENLANAEDIDSAMKNGAGHPMGPLELADLIGTDVCLTIMDTLLKETGDPKYRANPLLRKMVRANLFGRKVGRGFYSYTV